MKINYTSSSSLHGKLPCSGTRIIQALSLSEQLINLVKMIFLKKGITTREKNLQEIKLNTSFDKALI